MSRMIGYARAPTEQLIAEQIEKLTAAGCTEVYQDKAGSDLEYASSSRNMGVMFNTLSPGDTLVICKIEVLSTEREIAILLIGMFDDGVELKVLDEEIDYQMLREEAHAAVRDEYRRAVSYFIKTSSSGQTH